ncbi:MAG: TlpA disulfide reductase family protein [Bacteroidota bacterium]|nr:TlpA disulfide reductase family protein [Bacteroidota bacterium]
MKKLDKLIACLLLFSVMACQQNNYHINGHITGMKNGSYIMLFKFSGDTISSVDTTTIQNNQFVFEGPEFLFDIAIVTAGNYPDKVKATELVLDRGNIHVTLDSVALVTGSPMNEIYNSYQKKFAEYNAVADTLISHGTDPEKRPLDPELLKAYTNARKYKLSTIENEIINPVGLRLFKNEIIYNNIDDSLFQVILGKIPTRLRSEKVITEAIELKRKMREDYETQLLLKNKKYFDFDMVTPENKAVKLSDYIGNPEYTIIEFWASWCAPCIREVPNLNKVYNKYKDKGLQIISISVDESMPNWQRVIKQVDAPWVHLSDLKGMPSALTKAYVVNGIPHSLLIDKNGIIVEPKLYGPVLDKVLEQAFDKIYQ